MVTVQSICAYRLQSGLMLVAVHGEGKVDPSVTRRVEDDHRRVRGDADRGEVGLRDALTDRDLLARDEYVDSLTAAEGDQRTSERPDEDEEQSKSGQSRTSIATAGWKPALRGRCRTGRGHADSP